MNGWMDLDRVKDNPNNERKKEEEAEMISWMDDSNGEAMKVMKSAVGSQRGKWTELYLHEVHSFRKC